MLLGKKLYDNSFHEWKSIPLKLMEISSGSHIKFDSNLLFNISCTGDFASFTKTSSVTGKNISQPIQKLYHVLYFIIRV